MVRRWSSINKFNLFFKLSKINFFKKIAKKRIFKLTVSTRKFYKKYSRFRRKAFNRLRHKANWTVYTNVFKFWAHDYLTSRSFYRKYWSLSLYVKNFLAFNWNSLKNVNVDLFSNFKFHLSSFNSFFNYKKKMLINDNLLLDYNKKNTNTSAASTEKFDITDSDDLGNIVYFYDFQFFEDIGSEYCDNVFLNYYLFLNQLHFNKLFSLYKTCIYLHI